ncbi:hypothetical protein KKF91_17000 [Myxococcota bacterium]|nr:hypothetical protein [Myxococcota bacterium]MBU1432237.1 hypothetical protein [Myxococcota bacterium]MBU1897846.1 hypothetical protein [Myxococcota bacterium]
MRWAAPIAALCLLVLSGCDRTQRDREIAVVEIDTLSKDQCIIGWVSEAERSRLKAAARAGRIAPAQVDAYVAAIRAAIKDSERRGMSVNDFCLKQRALWRQHIH